MPGPQCKHCSVSLRAVTYERLSRLRDTPYGRVSFDQVIARLIEKQTGRCADGLGR